MFNKLTNLILLFSLLSWQAVAQTTVVSDLVSGTHFQAAVGYKYQQIDLQNLNQSLRAAGYPSLSENINSVGFLTNRISNNWVFSLKTFYSFTNEVAFDNKEVEYRQQQIAVGAGYNVLGGDKLKLVPSLMAGLGRNVLLIQEKKTPSANFQDQLSDPELEADFRNFAYLADVGLALHYQFFKRTEQEDIGPKSSWIPLVVKAGYQFQLGANDFKFDGDKMAGVPEIGMDGFYVSVFIGFGSKILAGR